MNHDDIRLVPRHGESYKSRMAETKRMELSKIKKKLRSVEAINLFEYFIHELHGD